MNAHVDFESHEQNATLRMVARHMIKQQEPTSWMDTVGGCDDCSTVPFDAVAAGRTRTLVLEGDRLAMRECAYGSILG